MYSGNLLPRPWVGTNTQGWLSPFYKMVCCWQLFIYYADTCFCVFKPSLDDNPNIWFIWYVSLNCLLFYFIARDFSFCPFIRPMDNGHIYWWMKGRRNGSEIKSSCCFTEDPGLIATTPWQLTAISNYSSKASWRPLLGSVGIAYM